MGNSLPTPALNHWVCGVSPKSGPFTSGNEELVSLCFSINSSTLILNTNSIEKEYSKAARRKQVSSLNGFGEIADWSMDVFF